MISGGDGLTAVGVLVCGVVEAVQRRHWIVGTRTKTGVRRHAVVGLSCQLPLWMTMLVNLSFERLLVS